MKQQGNSCYKSEKVGAVDSLPETLPVFFLFTDDPLNHLARSVSVSFSFDFRVMAEKDAEDRPYSASQAIGVVAAFERYQYFAFAGRIRNVSDDTC